MPKIWSIRTRFILLALIAVLPGIVIAVLENLRQHEISYKNELQDLEEITNAVTSAQEKTILSIKQSLITTALLSEQPDAAHENCSEALKKFLTQLPNYNNVLVVDIEGKPICIGHPLSVPFDIQSRPYIQKAIKEGKITASGYQLSQTTGKPSVAFAFPLVAQGRVEKVAIVSVETGLLASALEKMRFTKKLIVGVMDNSGKVLVRRPAMPRLEGQIYPIKQLVDAAHRKSPSYFRSTSADGVERFFWIAPVLPEWDAPFSVFVASTHEDLLKPFDQAVFVHLSGFMVTVLTALIGIWLLGESWMLRPLRRVLKAIGSIAGGDFSAKTGVAHLRSEIGVLGHHVDEMAQALSRRDFEVHEAREKNRNTGTYG